MKLPRLIALHAGLAAALLSSSLIVFANPDKQMHEHQQISTQDETKAAKAAKPEVEARPAATTSHKKHSVQSKKAEMIKSQKKATHKAIKDAEAASPEVEARPAATTKQ